MSLLSSNLVFANDGTKFLDENLPKIDDGRGVGLILASEKKKETDPADAGDLLITVADRAGGAGDLLIQTQSGSVFQVSVTERSYLIYTLRLGSNPTADFKELLSEVVGSDINPEFDRNLKSVIVALADGRGVELISSEETGTILVTDKSKFYDDGLTLAGDGQGKVVIPMMSGTDRI